MASPVNVSAKIIVGFEDQFSVEACQAFENVKKCAEDAFKVMESFPKPLAPEGFQGDVTLFSQSVEKFESSINRMNGSLIKSQEEVKRFDKAFESSGKFAKDFWESMKQGSAFSVTTTIAGLAIGLAGLSKFNVPLAGLGLAIVAIGLNAAFLVSFLSDVEESLRAWEDQKLIEPKISEDSILQLERFSSSLELLTNTPDFQFKVDLLDNATGSGLKIRRQLEVMFKPVITQPITTKRVDAIMTFRKSSGGSSSGTEFSDPTGFDGSSVNPGGFNTFSSTVPGFASGIDRVPRDMLAMIHKDEAVLNKNRAEDFRRGNSGGMTIQNLEFNFNVPNGLKLGREEFRNLAFQMRDELKRLDARMN